MWCWYGMRWTIILLNFEKIVGEGGEVFLRSRTPFTCSKKFFEGNKHVNVRAKT